MEKILEYQELDGQLKRIDDELQKSDKRLKAKQAQNFLRDAEEKLKRMNQQAIELNNQYAHNAEIFKKNVDIINDYESNVGNSEDKDELSYLQKKVMQVLELFNNLEKDLANTLRETEEVNKNYEILKEKVPRIRKSYMENRQLFENQRKAKQGEINDLKTKLAALEKQLDATLMAKYKQARAENIFPVFVKLAGSSQCSGCRMDLPLTAISKLQSDKYIRCENCNRLIYK